MIDYLTNKGMDGLYVTNSTDRRLIADIVQPLDYVSKELVSEFIENRQQRVASQKTFLQKLLGLR